MQIILYEHTGAIESIVMGAMLRGEIITEVYPGNKSICSIKHFAARQPKAGHPIYLGEDKRGHEYFAVAVGNERWLAPKAIRSILELYNFPQQNILLIDAQKYSNYWIKIGGIIAVNFRFKTLGLPLVLWGLHKNFPALKRYIDQIEFSLA